MELIFVNINSVLNDCLIVTNGTKIEHLKKVREVMKVLNERQTYNRKQIKMSLTVDWLGYNYTELHLQALGVNN